MIWRFMILCFLLTACSPIGSVVNFHDNWTGIDTITTNEQEIFRDRQGVMLVRPAITSRGGQRAATLKTLNLVTNADHFAGPFKPCDGPCTARRTVAMACGHT